MKAVARGWRAGVVPVVVIALAGFASGQTAQPAQAQPAQAQAQAQTPQANQPGKSQPQAQPPEAAGTASGGTSVIYGTGTVFVNGAQLGNSSALMTGDVVQTKEDGAANISLAGSSAVVDSNSIVRAQGDGFSLDRGSISVATGKSLSVYARDLKITPVSSAWTQYYVTRSSGTIGILARKSAVTVTCGTTTETVREGSQLSREDAASCGLMTRGKGAPAAAKGPILTSAWAERTALIVGAGVAIYGLSHDDDPVSPDKP